MNLQSFNNWYPKWSENQIRQKKPIDVSYIPRGATDADIQQMVDELDLEVKWHVVGTQINMFLKRTLDLDDLCNPVDNPATYRNTIKLANVRRRKPGDGTGKNQRNKWSDVVLSRTAEPLPTQQHLIKKNKKRTISHRLFANGKVVVHGLVESDRESGCKWLINQLRGAGVDVCYNNVDINVTNYTSACQLRNDDDGRIPLHVFNTAYSLLTTYEPELFPGLVYRPPKSLGLGNIAVTMFHSGKMQIVGGNNLVNHMRAVLDLVPKINMVKAQCNVMVGKAASSVWVQPCIEYQEYVEQELRKLRQMLEEAPRDAIDAADARRSVEAAAEQERALIPDITHYF